MIAAIYARKSTDQAGAGDQSESGRLAIRVLHGPVGSSKYETPETVMISGVCLWLRGAICSDGKNLGPAGVPCSCAVLA